MNRTREAMLSRVRKVFTPQLMTAVFCTLCSVAQAQSVGGNFYTWMKPYLIALAGFAIVLGLACAIVKPEWMTRVLWTLGIIVVLFAVLKNLSGLEQALQ